MSSDYKRMILDRAYHGFYGVHILYFDGPNGRRPQDWSVDYLRWELSELEACMDDPRRSTLLNGTVGMRLRQFHKFDDDSWLLFCNVLNETLQISNIDYLAVMCDTAFDDDEEEDASDDDSEDDDSDSDTEYESDAESDAESDDEDKSSSNNNNSNNIVVLDETLWSKLLVLVPETLTSLSINDGMRLPQLPDASLTRFFPHLEVLRIAVTIKDGNNTDCTNFFSIVAECVTNLPKLRTFHISVDIFGGEKPSKAAWKPLVDAIRNKEDLIDVRASGAAAVGCDDNGHTIWDGGPDEEDFEAMQFNYRQAISRSLAAYDKIRREYEASVAAKAEAALAAAAEAGDEDDEDESYDDESYDGESSDEDDDDDDESSDYEEEEDVMTKVSPHGDDDDEEAEAEKEDVITTEPCMVVWMGHKIDGVSSAIGAISNDVGCLAEVFSMASVCCWVFTATIISSPAQTHNNPPRVFVDDGDCDFLILGSLCCLFPSLTMVCLFGFGGGGGEEAKSSTSAISKVAFCFGQACLPFLPLIVTLAFPPGSSHVNHLSGAVIEV